MFGRKSEPVATPTPVSTYESYEKKMAADMRKDRAESSAREEARWTALVASDEAQQAAAKTTVPLVKLRSYRAGEYLCYGTVELPVAYIASIEITEPGSVPKKVFGHSFGYGAEFYATEHPACIAVKTTAGVVHQIKTSCWEVDALLDALLKAWRGRQ